MARHEIHVPRARASYGEPKALGNGFLDEIFGMGGGYVLDFSNRTFAGQSG
jgi:hypothetical protein